MKYFKTNCYILIVFLFAANTNAQIQQGHTNRNKFKQLYDQFATPNRYHNASGAPGVDYYQQKVDYKMDLELDDVSSKLYGEEVITYTNNSPDELPYLWLQLDQNIRKKDAPSLEKNSDSNSVTVRPGSFASNYAKDSFDGGFNIEWVKDANGNSLPYKINQTMMRVDLPRGIDPGEIFIFKIKWWYNINNHVDDGGRSGYEFFPEDGNKAYVIAQFFPRLCVYNDVEGWQNYQFWGNGEFALEFGDYQVNITVPSDHIMEATGRLQNPKEVLTRQEYRRFQASENSFDKPVIIVTEEEAKAKESSFSKKKSTWQFNAKNVRDFGFATSRKFIWDQQAVQVGPQKVMAVSLYPKEGNPLWEEYSTKAVVQTLKSYSKFTFDYPYPKAVSVHAKSQGMEYPMICWNYGRPDQDGTYSDRTKFGMISVIIHEVGHNYFPMIVNSDERQWGWMDEGLDTFMQYLTEQEFGETYPNSIGSLDVYPSRRGDPKKIVPYMSGNQDFISPIMSNPENVYQLGANAYAKPATALNILRETIMGRETFDHAFKTYSQRWMFKHPTPEDFFRTMEDASAIDLDWFWRGWFYTTDYVDIGVEEVKHYRMQIEERGLEKRRIVGGDENLNTEQKRFTEEVNTFVFKNTEAKEYREFANKFNEIEMKEGFSDQNFYEVKLANKGGLVMPVIIEWSYADGSTEREKLPAEIWRKNEKEVTKVFVKSKEVVGIVIDPNKETADVDTGNNQYPNVDQESRFDKFKSSKN